MIVVENVSKRYGAQQVLSEVSLVAPAGQITGFVGPNGAGKTTVMKIIAGVVDADEGRAQVDGIAYRESATPLTSLGVHISAEWLPAAQTGGEFLRFACHTQAVPPGRACDLLDQVGLKQAQDKRIGSYSMGMRQRLGIALALLGDPANLMLDEPVNGLDPNGVVWLRELLIGQAAAGKAVLLSSHLMAELELVADRVVMLVGGRVTHQGMMDDLNRGAPPPVYLESSGLDAVVSLLASRGFRVRPHERGALVEQVDAEAVGRTVFGAGLALSHLSTDRPSLEQVFLASTARSAGEGTA